LAIHYLVDPEMGTDSDTQFQKQIKTATENLKKYVTVVNHLQKCEKTFALFQNVFINPPKNEIPLSLNEINFADLRALDDDAAFQLYVIF